MRFPNPCVVEWNGSIKTEMAPSHAMKWNAPLKCFAIAWAGPMLGAVPVQGEVRVRAADLIAVLIAGETKALCDHDALATTIDSPTPRS